MKPRSPRSLSRTCLFFGLLTLLAVVSFGCRKVDNSNPNFREKRHHFFFFNYTVKGPDAPENEKGDATGEWAVQPGEFVGETLSVLLRHDAIPSDVLKGFTAETGAIVVADTYEDNGDMYDKVSHQDEYHVVMLPGFAFTRLVEEEHLLKMHLEAIPNASGIERRFYRLSDHHDPANALTYLWTIAGIAYHYEYFDDRPRSWKEFFEPAPDMLPWVDGKRSLLPSPRQNFAAALMALGYSPNTEAPDEIKAAERYLTERIAQYQLIDHDGLREHLLSEKVVMAQATSADVARLGASDIMFSVPQDGTWLYIDMLGISADLKKPRQQRLAHAFINYLLRPVVAAAVVEHSRHATTVEQATTFIRPAVRNSVSYLRGDPSKTFLLDTTGTTERLQEKAAHRFHPLAQHGSVKSVPVIASDDEKPAD